MSILNITHHPDRVLMVTDTEAVTPDQKLQRGSKIHVVSTVGGILAGHGIEILITSAYGLAIEAATASPEFDDLAERFGRDMAEMIKIVRKQARDWPRMAEKTTVYLAGYSRRAGRMAFWRYVAGEDFRGEEIQDATMSSPSFPELDGYCRTMDDLKRLAVRQREVAKAKEGPLFPAGAELVCAEVRRDGIRLWREAAGGTATALSAVVLGR